MTELPFLSLQRGHNRSSKSIHCKTNAGEVVGSFLCGDPLINKGISQRKINDCHAFSIEK